MSVVITENILNECIYDVIKKTPPKCIRSPRYKSVHSERVRCERKRAQDGHRTMGYAKYPLRSPRDFLKKKTGMVWVRQPDPCARTPKPKLKPPLPSAAITRSNSNKNHIKKEQSKTEDNEQSKEICMKICQCCNNNVESCFCCPEPCQPGECTEDATPALESKMSLQNKPSKRTKNVILRNILNVVHAKPKTPIPKYVDTRTGAKHNLIPSGTISTHIYRKSFGKTPKYVLEFISQKEAQKEREQDEELLKNRPACRYVTQDERDKLLQGLKKNWEDMQSRYQGLPILTDTIPKKVRKTQMEAELLELEKDIRLIEQHPYIYVFDD